jgi:hypothetical protein
VSKDRKRRSASRRVAVSRNLVFGTLIRNRIKNKIVHFLEKVMDENAESTPPLLWRGGLIRLATIFLSGFVVILCFTAYENSRRDKLERVEFAVAVEDTNFFPLSSDVLDEQPVLTFGRKPLFLRSKTPVKLRDTDMVRRGTDDSGGYNIYAPHDAVTRYLVKIGANYYLELRTEQTDQASSRR